MQIPQDVSEVVQLRRIARDLVAISTLPAVWNDLPSGAVIDSLAGVLYSSLDLDLAYIGLPDGQAIRTRSEDPDGQLLAQAAELAAGAAPRMIASGGGAGLRTHVAPMGMGSTLGSVVCASSRPDFPNEHERLIIGVGANHGAVVLQRRLAEEALKRSEARFLDMADTAPAMLWVTGPDGDCTFLSREWTAFTGQSRADGLGFGWTAAIHPEDREGARLAFLRANGEKKAFSIEHRLLHVDGSYRWVIDAGRARMSADGEFLGFVGNVLDISERKEAGQALHGMRRLLDQVFDALPLGLAVADQDGQVLMSNKAMGRYLPTNILPSLDDARRHRWHALGPDGQALSSKDFAAQRALNGERVFPGIEALYRPDDGAEIWTLTAAVPLLDETGAVNGQVCIVTDIDAFKRVEAALRLSEVKQRALFDEVTAAHRNLTEFLAVLAHELRNPLAPIVTGLEIMRMRADSADTVANVRGIIERQVKQLSHLINDLLDIARVTSGKIEVKKQAAELKEIVATAVETSRPQLDKGRHAFDLTLDPSPLPVHADPARIAQVISNLLTNAAKYTPAGGRIDMRVERDGDAALITVADNGIGIPAESLESVFDMFSQVGRNMAHAQGGLGIGLALVRQLVVLHGGTVKASSAGAGSGSSFVVRLPLAVRGARPGNAAAAGAASATADGAAVATTASRTLRILVTDDNEDAASTLAALLSMHGHDVRVAHNGPRALQVAAHFVPDLVFLDIGMPGMTGYEVAREMKRIDALRHATLVALSGWGARDDLIRSRQAGFAHHFIKPIALAEILAFLQSLV